MSESVSHLAAAAPANSAPATISPYAGPLREMRRSLVAVGALALFIRLVYLWEISKSPFWNLLLGDGTAYDKWARQIAAGEWIGKEVFYQAPLYPYFLGVIYAVFHPSIVLVRFVQVAFGALSCVLLAIAGVRLLGKRAGLIAGLLLAVYPPAIFFDSIVQKSVLDLLFMCALFVFIGTASLMPRRAVVHWLLAGVSLAALILTRENAIVLLGVLPAWIGVFLRQWPVRERAIRACIVLLGAACILMPVAFRNKYVGGEFHLTTSQFGPNFYIGNNAGADGTYSPLRFGRGDAIFERKDATELAEAASGRKLTPGEVSSYWVNRTLGDIRESPVRWLRLMWRKWLLTWNAIEVGDTEDIYTYAHWSWLLRAWGAVFHFGTLAPIAAVGVLLTLPHLRRGVESFRQTFATTAGPACLGIANAWLIHLLLWSLAASIVAFYLFGRYRFPLTPVLILLAALAISWVIDAWRRGAIAAIGMATLLAGVAAVASNVEIISKDLMVAATYRNLGFAIVNQSPNDEGPENQRRITLALTYLRQADAMTPDNPMVLNNIGGALARQGKTDEAIGYFERAIKLKADFAFAHYNLATALVGQRKFAESLRHLGEAAKYDPRNPVIPQKAGDAYVGLGRMDDAVKAYQVALMLDPNFRDAHNSLGIQFAKRGKMAEAAQHFAQGVRIAPNDASLRVNLGRALLMLGQYPGAINEFHAATRLAPRDIRAKALLGQALAGAGNWKDAGLVLSQVATTPEARAEDFALLAKAAAHQGDARQAIAAAERALSMARRENDETMASQLENDLVAYRAMPDQAP